MGGAMVQRTVKFRQRGVSFVSANVFYALSTSDTNAPADSAFTYDNFPPLNAGNYVWQATKVTDSEAHTSLTGKMCLGPTTDFLSGTEVYAVSTSNSEAPDDNDETHTYWNTSYTKEKGKYLWTATRVQYTNGSYDYLYKKCVGYWGEDGNDASEVNPNILLRTIFDKTIDFVLEAWTRSHSYINIDSNTNTIVNGRKSIRLNASSYSSSLDFRQNVYSRIKTSTWYTLSFNYFATQEFWTFIYDGDNSHGVVDRNAGYYVDGLFYNSDPGIDGSHNWSSDWSGKRHSFTFKTKGSFGTSEAIVLFRCNAYGQLAVCMPKLEEGKVATAYMAHEDDLKGANGQSAPYDIVTYGISKSRTSYSTSNLYHQVSGDSGWYSTAPSATTTYPYVWEKIDHYNSAGTYQSTSYVCMTGEDGQTGPRGKMSRNLWYAGLMSEVGGTTFNADDYQAPYVNIGTDEEPHCYAYVGSDGTGITYPNNAGDYTLSNGWEEMDSDFKYLIAKAVFAEYAKLGSAVFSKDFMFSQYLNNEFTMFSGSFTHPALGQSYDDYHLVPNQSSIPVVAGTQYKISVTCWRNSSYNTGIFARVYYLESKYADTDSNWKNYNVMGKEFFSTSDVSEATYDIEFTAEKTGYVRIAAYGYGYITTIKASVSDSYDKVSPMFINSDPVPLQVTSGNSTNSTSETDVNTIPIPIVQGRTYRLSLNGYVTNTSYYGFIGVYYDGSTRHEWSFNNAYGADDMAKTYTFKAGYTGYAYLKFKVSYSSTTVHVNKIYIQCTDAFVPTAAVNWLTGYAHFAGDRVRFNPDGSGHMAGGRLAWDKRGNISMRGTDDAINLITENDKMYTVVQAGHIEIRSKTTQSYGIFEINGLGEVILSMYDKDGNCVINLGGTPNALVNGEWVTWKLCAKVPGHTSDGKSYYAVKDSDCTKYYQLKLGQVKNTGSSIQYYLPPSWNSTEGKQTTDTDVIARNNMVFTNYTTAGIQETMETEIKGLQTIPDGYYVKPNNGVYGVEANINGSTNYIVPLYHFVGGVLTGILDQRFSL